MIASVPTDTETAPTETDVEALHDTLFGAATLDAMTGEAHERDELDAYATVREVAEEHPAVARKGARDGTATHYRGTTPFDYSIRDRQTAREAGGPGR